MHRLCILTHDDDADTNENVNNDYSEFAGCRAQWSIPTVSGDPPRPRRGHSTNVIGDNLLVFGGQDMVTSTLENDVRVLHAPSLRWKKLRPPGEVPCPRRGFKNQYFGTSLVISSGFIESPTTGKMDTQLPDSDVHILTIV